MGQSILVFVSHSSDDKESFIEPIVRDLETCYINVWLDKRKIIPGDNLRKSIFRDGIDKADIALIFFTNKSLKSSWVDREIKHILREEAKKGNDFDLNKIISIFDSQETYNEISKKYPELTDDLLHLMPVDYNEIHLGKLISAIWSKYLSLQGGDVETQRKLLAKDREIFQKEKDIQTLKNQLKDAKSKNPKALLIDEFIRFEQSGEIDDFIKNKDIVLHGGYIDKEETYNLSEAVAFGLIEDMPKNRQYSQMTEKGREFFKWLLINEK